MTRSPGDAFGFTSGMSQRPRPQDLEHGVVLLFLKECSNTLILSLGTDLILDGGLKIVGS